MQRLSHIPTSSNFIIALVTGASAMFRSKSDVESKVSAESFLTDTDFRTRSAWASSSATGYHKEELYPSTSLRSLQSSEVMRSTSSLQSGLHVSSRTTLPQLEEIQQKNVRKYDYVIVGHGKAGKSALRTLRRLDPKADIAVIEPFIVVNENMKNSKVTKRQRREGGTLDYLPARATYIQHTQKLIEITPTPGESSSAQPMAVHYRKSALIATGSRGSPPPSECISQDAYSRVLELRSTSYPLSSTLQYARNDMNSMSNEDIMHFQKRKKITPLPILNPLTVRSMSVLASHQGATVAVLGSSFEALELAATLARISHTSTRSEADNKVILLSGSSGPMSSILPRYLSSATSKRLRQFGVQVEDRSMTRYISMNSSIRNDYDTHPPPPHIEIYTVKSYDPLDTKSIKSDLLVLAPCVSGLHGTAVLPTIYKNATERATNGYEPWSSLIFPPLLTCYLDDGRIATNAEFHAASCIYAAGSVAKYPNARTGQPVVAGGFQMNAELSGEVAAQNMVYAFKDFTTDNYLHRTDVPFSHVQESLPLWRSDVVPYLQSTQCFDETHDRTKHNSAFALYSIGIHALCIGNCDARIMATHGFWWTNTNQPNESRDTLKIEPQKGYNSNRIVPNAFMKRATRRMTRSMVKGNVNRGVLPVYGSGIVYYVSRNGSLEGVMLWGLPFSQDPSNVESNINEALVQRIKKIIRSNGGIAIRDHSEKIRNITGGVKNDVNLLRCLHLSEESKHLATMALVGSAMEDSQQCKAALSRPLHRYTPWKGSDVINLGKLRRKNDAGQLLDGDDLFYSYVSPSSIDLIQNEEDLGQIPSIQPIYKMPEGIVSDELDLWLEDEDETKCALSDRSRPPREDPLWQRRGEEHRFINKKDSLADAFLRNMLLGQFSDGSKAV